MDIFRNQIYLFSNDKWIEIKDRNQLQQNAKIRFILSHLLTLQELEIVYTLSQFNISSIAIVTSYNESNLLKLFQLLSTHLRSIPNLTELSIFSLFLKIRKDCKDTITALMNCIGKSISTFEFSIHRVDDPQLINDLFQCFSKYESLQTLAFNSEGIIESGKEKIFEGLQSLRYLKKLKMNLPTSLIPAEGHSKCVNVILPECQELELHLSDLQFFSNFKEWDDLRYLHLKMNDITREFLSQIVQNYVPNLRLIERITFSFISPLQQLIEFSGKVIQQCLKLNQLELIFYHRSDPSLALSHLQANTSIKNVTILIMNSQFRSIEFEFEYKNINIQCLRSVQKLDISYQHQTDNQSFEEHKKFIKKLSKLDSLLILLLRNFQDHVVQVKKSKRLVICRFYNNY